MLEKILQTFSSFLVIAIQSYNVPLPFFEKSESIKSITKFHFFFQLPSRVVIGSTLLIKAYANTLKESSTGLAELSTIALAPNG